MKKIILAAFVCCMALGIGYGVYNSQNKEELTDLALGNIEALAAAGESHECCHGRGTRVCSTYNIGSPAWSMVYYVYSRSDCFSW